MSGNVAPEGMAVLELLRKAGRIDVGMYERVMSHARMTDMRLEEAILVVGAMDEQTLLQFLANQHRTRFISTEKLSRANITRAMVEMVPRRFAERFGVFPVLFDRPRQSLTVVAADVSDPSLEKQVMMASGARYVSTIIGRPAAVEALIRKFYYGEKDAFSRVPATRARAAPSAATPHVQDFDFGGAPPPRQPPSSPRRPIDPSKGIEIDFGGPEKDDFFGVGGGAAPPPGFQPGFAPTPQAKAKARPQKKPEPRIEADEALAAALQGRKLPPPTPQGASPSTPTAQNPPAAKKDSIRIAPSRFLETLNVMVALLEQDRGELRGHTSLVARLTRKMCDTLSLPKNEMFDIVVAAYIHDVGKAGQYHLTALNVAQYEGHKVQAQKVAGAPLRLFESAGLSERTEACINHLYERYDGTGFPDRMQGKDIPLGARLLAVVETFADLTTNAKNPFRRKLAAREACAAISKLSGSVFDPTMCELMQRLAVGDEVRSRLLDDARLVLIVDPDAEATTVLEMRLLEHGHRVAIARTVSKALDELAEQEVDFIVTEVDLPEQDGFALIERVRSGSQPDVPFIFMTRRGDRDSVTKGLGMGAADYVVKPASPELVAAKIGQSLAAASASRTRGVSGSLREMALPDVVQILANGRKSGKLTLKANGQTGEIHFGSGAICDARFGSATGAEGFYEMLMLQDGEFSLDPSFVPERDVIQMSTDGLLLEGMRRMDEGGR